MSEESAKESLATAEPPLMGGDAPSRKDLTSSQRRAGQPRRLWGIVAGSLAFGAQLLPYSAASGLLALAFACVVCAIAIAPSSDRGGGSLAGRLPVAFVLLIAEGTFLSLGLGMFARVELWDRGWSLVAWGVMTLPWLVVSGLRGGRFRVVRGDVPASATILLMLLLGLVVAVWVPFEEFSRIQARGTDMSRHVVMMKGVLESGGLSYENRDAWSAYPRGLNAFVGILWRSSGGSTFSEAFFALSGVLWLAVSLLAASMVSVAHQVARGSATTSWLSSIIVPLVIVLAVLQGMWVTVMWSLGFATAIVGGLCLAVACQLALPAQGRERATALLALGAVAFVSVHTWTLVALPLALLALYWLVLLLVRNRPGRRQLLMGGLGLVVLVVASLPVALSRTGTANAVGQLQNPGVSELAWPGRWWWLALVLAVLMAAVAWRHGQRRWSSSWALLLAATIGELLAIAVITKASWAQPTYYLVKLLWIGTVLVLPAAVAGGAWCLDQCFRGADRFSSRTVRFASRAALIAIVALLAAMVAGQIAGGRSRLLGMFAPTPILSYQNIVTGALKDSDAVAVPPDGVLVWGISPFMKFPYFPSLTTARTMDALAGESLNWYWPDRQSDFVAPKNEAAACEYLRSHPSALRVTGPSTESGPAWLVASGCPESVVRPELWRTVDMPSQWVRGVWPEGIPFEHMSYREYREAVEQANSRPPDSEG